MFWDQPGVGGTDGDHRQPDGCLCRFGEWVSAGRGTVALMRSPADCLYQRGLTTRLRQQNPSCERSTATSVPCRAGVAPDGNFRSMAQPGKGAALALGRSTL